MSHYKPTSNRLHVLRTKLLLWRPFFQIGSSLIIFHQIRSERDICIHPPGHTCSILHLGFIPLLVLRGKPSQKTTTSDVWFVFTIREQLFGSVCGWRAQMCEMRRGEAILLTH